MWKNQTKVMHIIYNILFPLSIPYISLSQNLKKSYWLDLFNRGIEDIAQIFG